MLVRLMIWVALRLGWPVGQALLYPITAYFFLLSRGSRRASRDFLSRALGRNATGRDVFRHLFTFSCVLFDRIFLLSNRLEHFRIDVTGLASLEATLAQGRGCVLIGAHLGSFEALRAVARQSPTPVKVLMYRANNGPYSRLVERLDPTLGDAIIDIGTPEAMLRVRESLERGEMVGILADRAPAGQKMIAVPFLGTPAALPTGPLVLCAALGAPVVLLFGVRTAPRRYSVHFEPFADPIALGRSRRAEDITEWLARYAQRLETQCRAYPFNWFNFYDFWEKVPDAVPPAQPRPAIGDTAAATACSGRSHQRSDANAGPHSGEARELHRGKDPRHVDPAVERDRSIVLSATGTSRENHPGATS
jgi:predicted LPLAT superfamily acyltransferase